ncbi:hypothetical protein [Embleya sp. NBC_00896]|nr:hypothetical protein OG928_47325 [Embleya sp. NBC_00896]
MKARWASMQTLGTRGREIRTHLDSLGEVIEITPDGEITHGA